MQARVQHVTEDKQDSPQKNCLQGAQVKSN